MERKMQDHTDRDGMIATSFLLLYLLFSYVLVYWTKTVSGELLSRENLFINLCMYVIPSIIVISMVFLKDSSLTTMGLTKKSSPFLFALIVLSMVFYTSNMYLKILIVVTSEQLIFRGYASDRLEAAYGPKGSILVAGLILGLTYSLIPFVNQHMVLSEFGMYIGLGILTQWVLQLVSQKFGNHYISIILHSGILFIAL